MPRQDFIEQLKAMQCEPSDRDGSFITFPYTIPVGRLAGTQITLGFQVTDDFPMNPPGGPHVSPRLMPQNPSGGTHPTFGIHASNLGEDWQYWSRPFPNWPTTDRTVKAYMAHIRHLFDTL